MLILNSDHVKSVLTMKDCMDALEEAYRENALGRAVNHRRTHLHMTVSKPDRLYRFKTMPGGIEKLGLLAIRLNSDMMTWPVIGGKRRQIKVAAAAGNRFVGQILLYNAEDIRLLAILSEGAIQLYRVGGTGGISAKYMARKDAEVVGLFGSGQQARTQVLAHCQARSIRLVKVFSPNADHRRRFAEQMTEEANVEIRPVSSPEECAKGADILAVATDSREPVLRAEWLEPGMHVTGVGNELDAEGRKKVHVYAQRDRRIHGFENCWTEGSKERMAKIWPGYERVYGKEIREGLASFPQIGEIILGKISGRESDEQITYFHTDVGLGIEFAAVGARVMALAKERGLGLEVPDDWFSQVEHT
jgi:ornithine cyclodeaminase/alanine dehydrogenase-like protein (mu-crystallin family)